MEAIGKWHILKSLSENNCQPRVPIQFNVHFILKNDKKVNIIRQKQRIFNRATLKYIQMNAIQAEEKWEQIKVLRYKK